MCQAACALLSWRICTARSDEKDDIAAPAELVHLHACSDDELDSLKDIMEAEILSAPPVQTVKHSVSSNYCRL